LGISPAAYRRRFSTATTGRIETERRFMGPSSRGR
jgi:hypothetical protein